MENFIQVENKFFKQFDLFEKEEVKTQAVSQEKHIASAHASPKGEFKNFLFDFGKNLVQPFFLPDRQIAHAGEQEILRFWLLHKAQLPRKEFWLCKILDHMIPLYIIPGITVITTHGTSDYQIHILDLVLDTDAHSCHPSRFMSIRSK